MSIRKHANEFKVPEKTVGTEIKHDLSLDLSTLDYTIWGVLENKINVTYPNIVGYLMPNTFYTYLLKIDDLVWFDLVSWHINNYRLFLYIFIKNI